MPTNSVMMSITTVMNQPQKVPLMLLLGTMIQIWMAMDLMPMQKSNVKILKVMSIT